MNLMTTRNTISVLSRYAICTVVTLSALACVSVASAKQDVPKNLGNGLDRLVASNVAIKQSKERKTRLETFTGADGKAYTTEENAGLAAAAIRDVKTDRIMVRINPNAATNIDALIKTLSATIKSFSTSAVDKHYRGVGVMDAYVSIDDVPALAETKGVGVVVLELKPRHAARKEIGRPEPNATPGQNYPNLGTYVDQGIFQHRVDALSQFYNPAAPVDYEGQGLSIACLSNSFAANTAHPASLDVTNNDLPGSASNPVNTQPVVVIQDDTSDPTSDDEGRGMCEIVYHMAPKARVGYATADFGEVGFANNIRALAGLVGFTYPNATQQGFAADVICDDVSYPDEPFFNDGIIANAIDDVASAGVSYFSSAGNDVGINGYDSVIRVVPNGTGLTAATNSALANTNINLTGVPANLYAGGFHNFNPNPGQLDVAQTVNIAANNTVPLQLEWNDAYDQATLGAVPVNQIYANTGTITATTTSVTYDNTSTPPLPPFNAGQPYVIDEKATSGNYDAIVTVIRPDGTNLLTQDTAADERVVFTAPVSGQYKITFTAFGGTTGSFTFTVSEATLHQYVTSDWNLLAFRTDTGAYVPASSLTSDNVNTNLPLELGFVNRTSSTVRSIQIVLARSNTPSGPGHIADHIRYLLPANGRVGYGPAEYFTYNTVTTAGHAAANGCNGVAAYEAFRPSIPQGFTSPGPVMIYFDKSFNALATPEVRLQPGIAAVNGANISLNEGLAGLGGGDVPVSGDSTSDYDTVSNFYGTSASAPHAAALALLVLQAHGGSRSVTPAQMTDLLHRSTFVHDLDPNSSTSVARASNGGKVTINFTSDDESNAGTGSNDANSLSIAYTGPSYIANIVFNPQGTAATGGNVTGGSNGLDASNNYFNNVFPGMVWTGSSITVGSKSNLAAADVTATFTNTPPPPSTTQHWTMTLNFPNSNFTGGKSLKFTTGRAIQHSSAVPSGTTVNNFSGDLFGGGVLIPEGTVTTSGMTYSGMLGDGSTFSGVMTNRIGSGFSVLDGFGFINEETAVSAPLQ